MGCTATGVSDEREGVVSGTGAPGVRASGDSGDGGAETTTENGVSDDIGSISPPSSLRAAEDLAFSMYQVRRKKTGVR